LVSKAKTDKEREVELKNQAGSKVKQAVRAATKQAHQQCLDNKRANNAAALVEYTWNALLLAQGFPGHV
jgi:hypothetical protein